MENKHEHGKLILIIALFSVAFFVLQIMDLALTKEALKDPRIRELNPLYSLAWFVHLKLSIIILIAPLTYAYGRSHPGLAYSTMAFMLIMYILIVVNNAYWLHSSGTIWRRAYGVLIHALSIFSLFAYRAMIWLQRMQHMRDAEGQRNAPNIRREHEEIWPSIIPDQ